SKTHVIRFVLSVPFQAIISCRPLNASWLPKSDGKCSLRFPLARKLRRRRNTAATESIALMTSVGRIGRDSANPTSSLRLGNILHHHLGAVPTHRTGDLV